jgi:energy-coupling factor transport system substrate-specific component
MLQKLTFHELIFIAILSAAIGVIWWGYSFAYNILSPLLKPFGLSGLIEGFWQFTGVFFAVIIRKPGSALIGSVIAASVEGLISQWGFSAVISGICQGLPVELVFLVFGYKKFNYLICSIGGGFAAVGGYAVTYLWYSYSSFSLSYNLIQLSSGIVSAIFLAGILARFIALKLAKTGVLNQFQIVNDPALIHG